jgi:hypothetical protein
MTMALELLIFTGVFALAIGLIGTFLGNTDKENRLRRAVHESQRFAQQPWDAQDARGRGNR